MTLDPYDVLGVSPRARHTEIRASYRRLMREHHPDLRPGDPSAEEMTRRLTAAWAVVGRPTARSAHDRARAARLASSPPLPRPDAAQQPAYSPVGTNYRRAFHLASLKVAAAVLALGCILLVTVSR
ncbi:MAG: DnaJ domain-containing protein [Nitriliruptorales bacterium]|nr:DnaJ domain-containing protein [Nitriliruptorales bacterium]